MGIITYIFTAFAWRLVEDFSDKMCLTATRLFGGNTKAGLIWHAEKEFLFLAEITRKLAVNIDIALYIILSLLKRFTYCTTSGGF